MVKIKLFSRKFFSAKKKLRREFCLLVTWLLEGNTTTTLVVILYVMNMRRAYLNWGGYVGSVDHWFKSRFSCGRRCFRFYINETGRYSRWCDLVWLMSYIPPVPSVAFRTHWNRPGYSRSLNIFIQWMHDPKFLLCLTKMRFNLIVNSLQIIKKVQWYFVANYYDFDLQ